MGTFTPTKQQQDVTHFFQAQFGPDKRNKPVSIFLEAVAGSGKTSSVMLQIEALKQIEQEVGHSYEACTLSFNTNIRDASQAKLDKIGSRVKARTTNQLGRSILVEAAQQGLCQKPDMADAKKYNILAQDSMSVYADNRTYFPNTKTSYKDYQKACTALTTLITAVRSTRTQPTEANILDLIDHYNMEDKIDIVAPWYGLVVSKVAPIIQLGIETYDQGYTSERLMQDKKRSGRNTQYKFNPGWHDFDDQICLPLQLNLVAPIWDVIFIDESQDLNRARLELVTHAIRANGVLFFVGDTRQSIQGFTFADTHAVQTIMELTNAVPYPLSVCWRCDEKIIRLAQALVPHIEAKPDATPGIVEKINDDQLIPMLQTGYKKGEEEKDPDLVLSRIKAPLVSLCLEAIRAGKHAIVRGRDIGSSTIKMLEDILEGRATPAFEDIPELISKYADKKITALNKKKNAEDAIDKFNDQIATLMALFDGYMDEEEYPDMPGFKEFVESKFADDETAAQLAQDRIKPIVFSTVHKAKGLEYDRVFIIRTDVLPHPMASPGWQSEQEENIIYVAVTRAKHELYFVGGVPAPLVTLFNAIKAEEKAELDAIAAVQEAITIVEDAPKTSTEPQEAPIVVEESVQGRKHSGGRVKFPQEDKRVTLPITQDPSINQALRELVNELLDAGKETAKKEVNFEGEKLSLSDVLQDALLHYKPFVERFEGSLYEQEYQERQTRLAPKSAKSRRQKKKAVV